MLFNKGIGVQAKIFNFIYFDICDSPIFLLSKTGLYFTQLSYFGFMHSS